ncbi:DUF1493 family protein [Parasedimentitalea maritima]|uniref:DUF1493 family protein n=1 Tax=Parasedimentitalea maritima TaxID=2578117 RepID=A0ABY2V2Y5_9RHOB|nr:DUF1493 family protein [Zongyanglinia marina]TLP69160.1 DUF1493 family protein [Zongyanglinia marina]
MSLREGILSLAAEFSCNKSNGTEQSDLLGAIGLEGADAIEFLEKYMERFSVDLSALKWEFHFNADEPPYRRRVLPVDVDGRVIPYMPLTLAQLVSAAELGRWQLNYPDHTLRSGLGARFSMCIAAVLLVLLMVLYSFL